MAASTIEWSGHPVLDKGYELRLSVFIDEHYSDTGGTVVAGATDGLEFDRDRGRAGGHQEEDLEENSVGVAGLGDRKPEDE